MSLTIGFLNDQILHRDAAGGLSCDLAFLRFLLAFRRRYERVVIFSRVAVEPIAAPRSVVVGGPGVEVVELPWYPRIADLFRQPLRFWPAIDRALAHADGLDALWLNAGHPVSVRALWRLRGRPTPRLCAALRGNYEHDAQIREGGGGRAAALTQTAMLRAFALLARRRELPVLAYGDAAVARAAALGMHALPFQSTLLDGALIADPPAADPALAVDVIAVGRLVREKGLDRLLAALPTLTNGGGAPARLAIVGDGPQRGALEAQVAALDLGDRVTFRGYVAHGRQLMAMVRSAGLLAMPSRTEGVPATALEAMAMRVPVVAAAVGGLTGLLAEGRGILVDGADVGFAERFGAALQGALRDPQARDSAAAAAFAHVADLTIEGQVDRVADLLGAPPLI